MHKYMHNRAYTYMHRFLSVTARNKDDFWYLAEERRAWNIVFCFLSILLFFFLVYRLSTRGLCWLLLLFCSIFNFIYLYIVSRIDTVSPYHYIYIYTYLCVLVALSRVCFVSDILSWKIILYETADIMHIIEQKHIDKIDYKK